MGQVAHCNGGRLQYESGPWLSSSVEKAGITLVC